MSNHQLTLKSTSNYYKFKQKNDFESQLILFPLYKYAFKLFFSNFINAGSHLLADYSSAVFYPGSGYIRTVMSCPRPLM